jgi:hypothetical protein
MWHQRPKLEAFSAKSVCLLFYHFSGFPFGNHQSVVEWCTYRVVIYRQYFIYACHSDAVYPAFKKVIEEQSVLRARDSQEMRKHKSKTERSSLHWKVVGYLYTLALHLTLPVLATILVSDVVAF